MFNNIPIPISKKVFKVETHISSYRIDKKFTPNSFGQDDEILEALQILVYGEQRKISSIKKDIEVEVFSKPKKATDWLKSLIIDFEPTLNFGWLIPRYEDVTATLKQEINNTFINVIPCPDGFENRKEMEIAFLTSMPYSVYELNKKCSKYYAE